MIRIHTVFHLHGDSILKMILQPLAWSMVRSHTFIKINHEIISTAILLPSAYEWLLSVTSESLFMKVCAQYVHEVLVSRLVKLA